MEIKVLNDLLEQFLQLNEMAKLNNIKIYDYIMFLLSERPSMNITDEELNILSPWSEGIQEWIQTFINSQESQ